MGWPAVVMIPAKTGIYTVRNREKSAKTVWSDKIHSMTGRMRSEMTKTVIMMENTWCTPLPSELPIPLTRLHSSTAPTSESNTRSGAPRCSLNASVKIFHTCSTGMEMSFEKELIPCCSICSATSGGIASFTAVMSSPARYCSTSAAGSIVCARTGKSTTHPQRISASRSLTICFIGAAAPRPFPAAKQILACSSSLMLLWRPAPPWQQSLFLRHLGSTGYPIPPQYKPLMPLR